VLQKPSDPKWISDLGPRLRGDDVVGVGAFEDKRASTAV
jgi:hypothetical protein